MALEPNKDVSKLIADLEAVPGIIANLGLGIAEAQKAMNLTYLESIERLAHLARELLGGGTLPEEQVVLILKELMKVLAPTRYQYTKTTMSVKLDLSQSLRITGQAGVGVSLQAIVVNAAMALSFGYDYRGAAEVQTVIDATPPGMADDFFNKLIDQAAAGREKVPALPANTPQTDTALVDAAKRISERLGVAPKAVETKPAETKPAGTTP